MKKHLTLLLLALCSSMLYAKVITVNNNPNAIGMYSNAQEAVDAAFVGDSIFLHASGTSYGNITIAKRITLIGEGYSNAPDGLAKTTTVAAIYLDSIPGGDPVSGTVIEGLSLSGISYISSSRDINRIVLKSLNLGTTYVLGNDWEIINCQFGNKLTIPHGYIVNQIIAFNSVFNNKIEYFSGGTFSNCIIKDQIYACKFTQFQNCIFTKAVSYADVNSNNIAVLNSSFSSEQTIDASRSNTATNCLFNTSPRFIDETHYQLKPDGPTQGSVNPLIDAGFDGTDIGITGGTYPINIMDGRINLPQVHQVEVVTGVIKPGDDLIINVHARTRK